MRRSRLASPPRVWEADGAEGCTRNLTGDLDLVGVSPIGKIIACHLGFKLAVRSVFRLIGPRQAGHDFGEKRREAGRFGDHLARQQLTIPTARSTIGAVTLGEALISVWRQTLVEGKSEVGLEGETYPVGMTRAKKLRTVEFSFGSHRIDGIEQNPQTGSRWAQLAREGKRIMQFSTGRRYFANVCEGKLLRYPAWRALELPE